MYIKCTINGDGKGLIWRWELGGEGKAFSTADRAVLQMVVITELTNFSYSQSGYPQFCTTVFSGTLRNIHRLKIDKPMTKGVLGGGYILHDVTATSSLLLSRDYKESPPSLQLVGVLWVGGDVGGGGSEDNIPGERVVCHPPARARRRATKTWNMNFWRR